MYHPWTCDSAPPSNKYTRTACPKKAPLVLVTSRNPLKVTTSCPQPHIHGVSQLKTQVTPRFTSSLRLHPVEGSHRSHPCVRCQKLVRPLLWLLFMYCVNRLNAQEERLATSATLVTRLHLSLAVVVRLHVVILTPETAGSICV